MKYLLFAYDNYYPCGGMRDLKGLFNTIDEAQEYYNKGYIPAWAYPHDYPDEDMEEYRQHWDEGQIVNATSLQVEKEL